MNRRPSLSLLSLSRRDGYFLGVGVRGSDRKLLLSLEVASRDALWTQLRIISAATVPSTLLQKGKSITSGGARRQVHGERVVRRCCPEDMSQVTQRSCVSAMTSRLREIKTLYKYG